VATSVQSSHFDLQQQDAGVPKTPMISIVDDDRAVRAATRGLVRSLGYDVSTFASAEEFLTSESLHETSCLITDLHMPGLSGIELQDRLIAQGHHLPIVFITAFPEESLRRRALEAGAICFLSKPYSDDRLIDCLDRALKSADGSLNR
jgi:FixJ family two-component response regulator